MSFATYTELQAELATWLRRTDLTASIPGFITLAEAQLNRKLRCQRMISRATTTLDADLVSAPTDFVAPRSLRITGQSNSTGGLRWVSDERMDDLLGSYDYTSGVPAHYTLEGGGFRLSPTPADSYSASLSYYAALPSLADNDSNWLLTSHPDAYLYGALLQSAPFLRADDRLPMWASLFERIIEDINTSDAGMGGSLEALPSTYGAGYI